MSKKTTVYVKTEETIVRRRQTVIKVESSYVQLYKNIRQYTLKMNPASPIDFMLFLITNMNDNNGITINSSIYKLYNQNLPKKITERTFYRLVKNLVQNNILIQISRGEYKVNPAIVWQGEAGTRVEHIKFLEEGGVKLKPNETLLLDKKQESDGTETINGAPEAAQEFDTVDYGELQIEQAHEYIQHVQEEQTVTEETGSDEIGPALKEHDSQDAAGANWGILDYPEPTFE